MTKLFTDFVGVEAVVTKAIRIGKKGSKPRLLKVQLIHLTTRSLYYETK